MRTHVGCSSPERHSLGLCSVLNGRRDGRRWPESKMDSPGLGAIVGDEQNMHSLDFTVHNPKPTMGLVFAYLLLETALHCRPGSIYIQSKE